VWLALLNLEYKYGNSTTLEAIFTKAVAESKVFFYFRICNALFIFRLHQGKHIYLAMADIFEKGGDLNGADATFLKALKRPQYKKSKKVWIAYHQFKIRIGDIECGKAQLARSMQSLSAHKHIETISKYALSEFEFGSCDRARVLFEELLSNYPKRSDLWHLYVDKEVKKNNILQARQLFERMIINKSSAKNMKSVFKKYLAFEIEYGDEKSQEVVKEKARDYVNKIV
jgi:rRNA biogenesis protein RRP5